MLKQRFFAYTPCQIIVCNTSTIHVYRWQSRVQVVDQVAGDQVAVDQVAGAQGFVDQVSAAQVLD